MNYHKKYQKKTPRNSSYGSSSKTIGTYFINFNEHVRMSNTQTDLDDGY